MNYNNRRKAIENFIKGSKTNKKLYTKKLDEEKNKLEKRGLEGSKSKQKTCANFMLFWHEIQEQEEEFGSIFLYAA